ncbi:MAG: rod shape-determining protein MreC [Patescibacteria group bacterium]
MSYLLDKKVKRKKFYQIVFFVFVFLILFYFKSGLFNSLSFVSHKIFTPVLTLGNNMGGGLGNIGAYFVSKRSLYLENEKLRFELTEDRAQMSNYNSLLAESINLKEILGRKIPNSSMILAAILTKPNQSPYDTLIIDVGAKEGLQMGNMVFALGDVPVGRVKVVYDDSSKIVLFSNSGEKTGVVVGSGQVFMEVVGRGGGNFEMIIPRDFILTKGDTVVLPGIIPRVLGIVQKIISDPRDSFQKALLVSPVNIQEIKFVEVVK